MTGKLGPEAGVKRAICELLDLYKIPYWRMNVGDRYGTYKGRTWKIAGHAVGTADILAAPRAKGTPIFLWIECKRPKGGKQTDEQLNFQRFVESQGHIYLLASSSYDVLAALGRLDCLTTEDNPKAFFDGPDFLKDSEVPF